MFMGLVPLDLIIDMAELSHLHQMVLNIRHIDIEEYLQLRPRPPVDTRDIVGRSPLFYAAARGDVASAQALLNAGADPEFPRHAVVPKTLQYACRYRDLDMVRLLVRAGTCHPGILVLEASSTRVILADSDQWKLDRYIEANVNNNCAPLMRTPLIWLAMSRNKRPSPGSRRANNDDDLLAKARELVEAGADIAYEDIEKGRPD